MRAPTNRWGWTLALSCSCIVLIENRSNSIGYTVFCLTDEEGHQGSGMTLAEAFAKMMALAHCDYNNRLNDDIFGEAIRGC
jgi:hypothetical protein